MSGPIVWIVMKKRFTAGILAALLIIPAGARAADDVEEQRRRVGSYEARLDSFRSRLSTLLSQHRSVSEKAEEASARLAVARLKLDSLERESAEAREIFNQRARRAYMLGGLDDSHVLLGLRSPSDFIAFLRLLGDTIEADMESYDDLRDAAADLRDAQERIDSEKSLLLESQEESDVLVEEIRATLAAEEAALDRARSVLASLEAERRSETAYRGVSPAVESMRSARQKVLDARLAALLAFYEPATGTEPFMPPKLEGTGIVSYGLSTWYGPGFSGRRAASGATFRSSQFTAASRVLPFGTLLKVTFRGRTVVVVITDRGPYVVGRVLDLSRASAQAIGLTGVQRVRMEIVVPTEPAPPFP